MQTRQSYHAEAREKNKRNWKETPINLPFTIFIVLEIFFGSIIALFLN